MPASAAPGDDRWWVGGLVGLAVLVRVAAVLTQDGVIYPDEVHQSLEQAHRLAFGAGFVPWEWEVGARHPLLAWLLAAVMKPGALVMAPQLAARLALAVGSGLTAWPIMLLVRDAGGALAARRLAGAAWALCSVGVLLGGRGLSESAVTLPLLAGLALALRPGASRRALLTAAALLSVAVMLRLQVALVPLVLLGGLALQRQALPLRVLALGLAGGAVVYGLTDWLAWGSPFQSAREYLRFNLVENGAATFGVEGPGYYLVHGFRSGGGLFVLSLAGLVAVRRAPVLAAALLVFCAAHLASPHKELRFLLPAAPLACVLVGLATERLPVRWARLAVLAGVVTQPLPRALSFRMLGVPLEPATTRAWDAGGSVNRLLARAGRVPDACGLRLDGFELGYSGAYAWFHAPHPLFDRRRPAPEGAVNLVIAPRDAAPVGLLLERDGAFGLFRVGDACAPVTFDWRLP